MYTYRDNVATKAEGVECLNNNKWKSSIQMNLAKDMLSMQVSQRIEMLRVACLKSNFKKIPKHAINK
jgi:hypothetical protein